MKLAFADEGCGSQCQKRKKLNKKKEQKDEGKISLLLEPKKRDWWEDEVVVVAYNVPRITARLEGLMGSNVVRLTDRNYMHQLRLSHEADCNARLQQRIEKREKQEMERERNLIIQGKLAKIPEELENHPVFIVNQKTNDIIANRRAKLKTNREKNSERLVRQGAKWERDRIVFEHLEKKKRELLKAQQGEQAGLEEQYRNEDAERGVDLLRIHDSKWKPCELDLKKFLESENALMKQRLIRKSTQYSSDPKDVQNVAKARKKFKETEEKIRKRLEEQLMYPKEAMASFDNLGQASSGSATAKRSDLALADGASSEDGKFAHSDIGLQSGEDLSIEGADSQPDTRANYAVNFEKQMENDIEKGLVLTKTQFDAVHYEDPLIAMLKKTENVHDLYKVAIDIVCSDSAQFVYKTQDEQA